MPFPFKHLKDFCKALRYNESNICPLELCKAFFHIILDGNCSTVEQFLYIKVGLLD